MKKNYMNYLKKKLKRMIENIDKGLHKSVINWYIPTNVKLKYKVITKEVIMKKIGNKYTDKTFENIKRIDDYENEYWYARELSRTLEYRDWRNFLKVLNKAKEACKNSGFNVDE